MRHRFRATGMRIGVRIACGEPMVAWISDRQATGAIAACLIDQGTEALGEVIDQLPVGPFLNDQPFDSRKAIEQF
jgi:hypothetical protein